MTSSGGWFGKANFREIAKDNFLDGFIISYFRILPTDERFKSLSDEQKILVYYMVAQSPTAEDMRQVGMNMDRAESLVIGDDVKKLLKDMKVDEGNLKSELSKLIGSEFK